MLVPKPRDLCQLHVSRRAFSLVEVLVATAIMSLLMAILLPSLAGAREAARRTVCLSNLSHIGVSLFAYAADNREDGPNVMLPVKYRKSPRQLLSTADGRVNLGVLLPRIVSDPRLFHCPSQRRFTYSSELRAVGRDYVAGSYAYAVHIPAGRSPRLGAVRHLALVSDDYVAGSDHVGVGRYAHRQGYNVLYSDGSVSWYADPDESIWKRGVYWDDESDEMTYDWFYRSKGSYVSGSPATDYDGTYGNGMDVFAVWRSFCYQQPDPF